MRTLIMVLALLFVGSIAMGLEKDEENGYSPTPSGEPWELPYEAEPTVPPNTTDTSSYIPPVSSNPRDQDCSTPVTGPCLNVRLCSCW